MTDITITISGPGKTFSAELHVIKQALEYLGCIVTIEDPYQDDSNDHSIEEHVDRMKTMNKDSPTKVHIKANHMPWGG
jgi:hypothetical protein